MTRNKKTMVGVGGFMAFMLQLWKFWDWWGHVARDWFPWNFIGLIALLALFGARRFYQKEYFSVTDDEKEKVRNNLKKITKLFGGAVVLMICLVAIQDSVKQKPVGEKKTRQAQTESAQKSSVAAPAPSPKQTPIQPTPAEKPSSKEKTWGVLIVEVVSFVLLIGLSIFVFFQVVQDSKKTEDARQNNQGSRIDRMGIDWKKFFSNPTVYAAIAVVTINVFLMFGLPNFWIAFLWHFGFFVIVNLGAIIATHFFKKGGVVKIVGVGIVLIVLAVAFNTFRDGIKIPGYEGTNWSGTTPERPATNYGNVPAEVALPEICGCESSGVAGRIWHYKEGDPTKGLNISETNDIGGCQINSSWHEKDAKERYGLDIRKPEDNMQFAKVLYRNHGVQPWVGKPGKTTIHCWGPKLQALGFSAPMGLDQVKILESAPFQWSEYFVTKPGYNFTTDWVDPEKKQRHEIEYTTTDGVFVKTFPSEKKEKISGDVKKFRARSLEHTPVQIKITLTPH